MQRLSNQLWALQMQKDKSANGRGRIRVVVPDCRRSEHCIETTPSIAALRSPRGFGWAETTQTRPGCSFGNFVRDRCSSAMPHGAGPEMRGCTAVIHAVSCLHVGGRSHVTLTSRFSSVIVYTVGEELSSCVLRWLHRDC
jgi:hypothetical protein